MRLINEGKQHKYLLLCASVARLNADIMLTCLTLDFNVLHFLFEST